MADSIRTQLPASLSVMPGHLALLASVVPAARATEAKWGVPKEVTLGQVIFESSWGLSTLVVQANNFFGIMHSPGDGYGEYKIASGEVVPGQPQQVVKVEDFRVYKSPQESFDDHGRILATLPRYAPAMAVKADWKQFLIELMYGGYSTDRPFLRTYAELPTMADIVAGPKLCEIKGCIHYAQRTINAVVAYRFFDERALAWYETGVDPGAGEKGS